MTVEILESSKDFFFECPFGNSQTVQCFFFFQSCKSDLPLSESGYHKTDEHTVSSQSKRRCVDLAGERVTVN